MKIYTCKTSKNAFESQGGNSVYSMIVTIKKCKPLGRLGGSVS